MLGLLQKWLTPAWVILMLALAAFGVWRQPPALSTIAERVTIRTALLALFLILLGKLICVALVWFTLRSAEENRGWRYAWRAYSLADISKYLPGGFWGIASRIALYRKAGIDLAKGTRILLIETALLVGFSFVTGAAALLIARRQDDVLFDGIVLAVAAASLVVATWWMLGGLRPIVRLSAGAALVVSWLAFGMSFAIIAAPPDGLLAMLGRFNVGFAVGQLAIFAPSGIGVRELVIASLSGEAADVSRRLIVELVVAHRLIWLVADFAVLMPALAVASDQHEKRNASEE